jgi:hypothetical protein
LKNEIKAISNKMNALAMTVIPKDHLQSFLKLPLQDKIFGIKFFAVASKDENIIKMCEYAEKTINQEVTA